MGSLSRSGLRPAQASRFLMAHGKSLELRKIQGGDGHGGSAPHGAAPPSSPTILTANP